MIARISEWFRNLPRAARWGVLAGLVIVGYFLVVEPVLDRTNHYAARADATENSLRRAANLLSGDSDDGQAVRVGTANFGSPQSPTGGAIRPEAIQRAVDEVLEDHGITNRTKTERRSDLTGDKARALAPDGKIVRLIVEVSFEADQAVVARIIADLERSPVVSAVSRIKIDRTAVGGRFVEDSGEGSSGKVRATISAESWVYSRSTGPTGGVS